MKEDYFSGSGINAGGEQMLRQIKPFGKRTVFSFSADRAALLVIDMQDYFLLEQSHAFVPSAGAIVPGLQALIDGFHRRGRPVFFTRHLNRKGETGNMDRWWSEVITAENPLSRITEKLDTTKGVVLAKPQYDAFYRSDLEEQLRSKGVQQLVIGGVMTHLCCETTARAAFCRGYEVFFLVNAAATINREHHMASLRNLGHGFADLKLVVDILAHLQNTEAADYTL